MRERIEYRTIFEKEERFFEFVEFNVRFFFVSARKKWFLPTANFQAPALNVFLKNIFTQKRVQIHTHKPALTFVIFCILVISVHAQSVAPDEDTQSWNDVQLTAPMTKKVDFVLTGTFRFGDNFRKAVDQRLAVAFNLKLHDAISFQPSYTNISTTPKIGRRRTEHRLSLAATYKFPLKKFALTDRNLFERRLRLPQNSTRYRNRLMLEYPFERFFLNKLFVSDEIFYDWSLKRWSRNRFTIGAGKNLNKNLSLEIYYMRQNDGTTRPGDLHVLGTTTKVRF
jgi:hypothetical protein